MRSAYCKVLEIFVVSDKLGILYSYRYKVSNLLLNENLTQKLKEIKKCSKITKFMKPNLQAVP